MPDRAAFGGWVRDYQKSFLRADLISGATVWAVLVPTAMAYSGMVGVDAVIGLYSVPLAIIGYAFLGGSRLLVVGPDAAVAVLAGATLAGVSVGADPLVLLPTLGLMVGALYVLFYLLKLGWVADLIPDPVLKGFIEGMVWVTILKELPDILGFHLAGEAKGFFPKLVAFVGGLPDTHGTTTLVGGGCLLTLILLHRFAHRLPGPLIVLGGSLAVVTALGLDERGVAVMGPAEGGLSGMGPAAGFDLASVTALFPGALAVVVLGFTVSIAAAKKAAAKTGGSVDPNQELLGVGASNLAVALGGGYPVAGTLSKTAVAIQTGGKTQLGNLFAGVLSVLTILFLLPMFAVLADAMLAALVVFVLLEISDIGYFRDLLKISRLEFVIAMCALVGVLLFDVMGGVMIGVTLSLVALVDSVHRPHTAIVGRNPAGHWVDVDADPSAAEIDGMRIWKQYAPLVFLNARRLSAELRRLAKERPGTRVIVIDSEATSGLDSTAISAFAAARDDLAAEGVEMWVAKARHLYWPMVIKAFENAGTEPPPSFDTLDELVEAFQSMEDPEAG